MGSIFEDRSSRKRRYRSNRKHYVGFSDLFGPHRRKFVKTRRQAVIALFIIFTIGILVIISSFSAHPREQANLDGIYENSDGSGYLIKFEGNTFHDRYQDYQDAPDIAKYYIATYSIPDGIENGNTILLTNSYNDTYSYHFEYNGDCIEFSDDTFCKTGAVDSFYGIVTPDLILYTGIFLTVLGGVPILFLVFRSRIFRRRTRLIASPKVRVSIPTATRQQVYARAGGRCERPRCSYHGKLHIHHIDENPSNNSPTNLLAVCPNCHARIHDGSFSIDAQRSWITL